MKPALLLASLVAAVAFAAAKPAQAGGISISIGTGGGYCGPRYVAPPVCYVPARPVCRPVVYYRRAPVYYAPARVVSAPRRAYRAPVISAGVTVGGPRYVWR